MPCGAERTDKTHLPKQRPPSCSYDLFGQPALLDLADPALIEVRPRPNFVSTVHGPRREPSAPSAFCPVLETADFRYGMTGVPVLGVGLKVIYDVGGEFPW